MEPSAAKPMRPRAIQFAGLECTPKKVVSVPTRRVRSDRPAVELDARMDILAKVHGGVGAVHEGFSWHEGLRLEQRRVGGIRIVSVGSGRAALISSSALACSAAAVAEQRGDECRRDRSEPHRFIIRLCVSVIAED